MNTPRYKHTSTLLPNGKVLIVGGWGDGGAGTASAEIFDPTTNKFITTGSMTKVFTEDHTATLLPNGKVLIVGAPTYGSQTAELYDPSTGTFITTGEFAADGSRNGRQEHTATMLDNGKVLIAGGLCFGDMGPQLQPISELYDPVKDAFNVIGNMIHPRYDHTATLLPNGKVLIIGGYSSNGVETSAEIYDPNTNTFTLASNISTKRSNHTATLLSNGEVLICGGHADRFNGNLFSNALNSAKIYKLPSDS